MTTLNHPAGQPSVTTGPITGSGKVYWEVGDQLRVPFRRIELINSEHLDLYDTSGPYTDIDAFEFRRHGDRRYLPAMD